MACLLNHCLVKLENSIRDEKPFERSEMIRWRTYLLLHFRPQRVNQETLRFTLSWGLGGMAATLLIIQLATGMLLKFVYVPTSVDAYASVQAIIHQVPFGRLVRNLHYWSANILVAVLFFHMCRVFFTGAFHPPRQLNWIIGLFLFLLILAANLSGYLLPYDQLAYWAVTVITAMLGYLPGIGVLADGSELGSQTLPFFYGLHTAIIPSSLLLLMGFHFWRIRKAGGLVIPRRSGVPVDAHPVKVPAMPHLLVREAAVGLVVIATLLMVAIFFDAAIGEPANPGMSPNPVRAPWYFAGFQELLLHIHPKVAVSVIPLSVALFLVCIPYLPYHESTAGIWFASNRGKMQACVTAGVTICTVILFIIVDTLVIKKATWAGNLSLLVRDGFFPLAALIVVTAGYIGFMKYRWKTNRNEIIQALVVAMAIALVVLTITGIYFRGPSMRLTWPV